MPAVTGAPSGRLRPGEDGRHVTFCRICEAFCGLEVDVRDGRATNVLPDRANPYSQGHVCVKGTSALELTYDPDRLMQPMRRTGGPGEFEPVSWEEAMTDIADRLAKIMRMNGTDAVTNYIGNPTAFNIGAQFSIRPFLAHFGIWKSFSSATQDTTARLAASHILYGSTYRLPIPDLPGCDFLLILGANPLVSHGSILSAPRIREDLDAIAARGRIVVIDPRRTETAKRFEHVSIRPDTDIWLLMAMINTLFDDDAFDAAEIERKTLGLDSLRKAIRPVDAEAAEQFCGIPAATIRSLASSFAAAPRAAAYSRLGLCRGRYATLANLLVDALNIVAGKFGVRGGWVFGDSPIDLAGLRSSSFGSKATRFGPRPNVAGNFHFSQLCDEILTPGLGQVRALLMEAGNIVLSAPGGQRLEEALQALDLFVSHDLYMNETNRFAHYILPGTSFLERVDIPLVGLNHMIRPAIQYTDAVLDPLGEGRDEMEVFSDLADRLHRLLSDDPGHSQYGAPSPPVFRALETVDDLLRAGSLNVVLEGKEHPLNLDVLKTRPHGISVAQELICTNSWEKICHKDGRIHLWHPMLDEDITRALAERPAPRDELRLFSMRKLQSINSWMHNIDRLVHPQHPALLMNPADAAERGISDGDPVEVTNDAGSIQVIVQVTSDVAQGAVCYPHGWGHRGGWQRANATDGANINLLADPKAGDLLSASSLLDGIIVEVRKSPASASMTGSANIAPTEY